MAERRSQMTTDIIKGVAARIYEIEGGRATIYTGEVPQGYEPQCFFIEVPILPPKGRMEPLII